MLESEEMSIREHCIVTSELLPYLDREDDDSENAKNLVNPDHVLSKFPFHCPVLRGTEQVVDEDGDLVLDRRENAILIEHGKSTTLNEVGLQVWRGALLLADWVIHNTKLLSQATVLELGSGTGLTSIAAALVAAEVISTDADIGNILALIDSNFKRNQSLVKCPYKVLELDFFAQEWSNELEEVIDRTNIVIAADVIYDDDLTEAFVSTLKRLLSKPPSKSIYMALEKRFVFTLEDLDSVAPCFEHFLRCIAKPDFPWKMETVDCDFPQYFKYERTKELALWKISSLI
ncbi:methyltransferase-like protein 22 isoform X2 [Neocloeon triangulifer]|uniref:methyltransferase-like protein 22 isoform X2 n=1 Tax=Neocloeon triangulifer TaxID=2078957 RepID=UPI00286F850A|nr:methyltransferase-like protein 22 isoform X2 [Neocloeon triangulifer]